MFYQIKDKKNILIFNIMTPSTIGHAVANMLIINGRA